MKHVRYRVVEYKTNRFATSEKNRETQSVVWEGEDVDELSRLHPPSATIDDFGHTEIEDGYVRWHYRFERQIDDGSWEECSDPRHRGYVTSDFLVAEKEEGDYLRRMYPGDYLDDEDDSEDYDEWM